MQSNNWPTFVDNTLVEENSNGESPDLFIEKDGLCYAGTHILLDCWDAHHLDDIDHIEQMLNEAVEITGATLLHIHLHHFTPNGGVSGVAVLAESHMSIHTWPEKNYAALDIFMCGDTQPEKAIAVFKSAFKTDNIQVSKQLRGILPKNHKADGTC